MMRTLLFVVALISGGAAFWLWLTQGQLAPIAGQGQPATTVNVLVATRDIATDATLAATDLGWSPVPVTQVAAGMVIQDTMPDAAQRAAGLTALVPLVGGRPVVWNTLEARSRVPLSLQLAADKRALAIVVSAASAVGGMVLPGDRIDLIVTRPSVSGPALSEVIAQNLLVLAVDQRVDRAADEIAMPARTLTLELSENEVPLVNTANASGTLSVALRARAR